MAEAHIEKKFDVREEAARLLSGDASPRPSIDEYMEVLTLHGKVAVPCPYGHGVYTIRLKGSFWYDTPEITFTASKTCPSPYNNPKVMAGGSFRSNEGRVIPWYPRWMGATYFTETKRELFLQFSRYIIGYIITGRRLYKLRCGQQITSLNDDSEIGGDDDD